LEAVVKVIKQQNLLSQVNEVGKHLWSGLHDLEVNIAKKFSQTNQPLILMNS
jgi:4-aminobutyrate aminotransferase-like enzyme